MQKTFGRRPRDAESFDKWKVGYSAMYQKHVQFKERTCPPWGGGRVMPYVGYIGMCRCEGNGFQAVYCRTGYINQSVRV